MPPLRVAHVAAEVAPWCTSGGLGQVLGALPDALAGAGAAVNAYFPLCRRASAELELAEIAALDGDARLLRAAGDGAGIYFIDAARYFDRESLYGPYGDPYPDDAERFSFFTEAVIEAWEHTGAPDVAHVHDWHAALLPHQLTASGPPTVLTIHNLAYQGAFADAADPALTNFLRTGIETADVVTTVSPTFAAEILSDGFGLEGSLAARAAPRGILNGIDTTEWCPGCDPYLPAPLPAGKPAARAAMAAALGLEAPDGRLIVGAVSRLVEQKGIDLLVGLAELADELDIGLVVLGDGDPELEQALTESARASGGRVAVEIGWNKGLAHLVTAGSDAIAIPSRFEPCGLTQMQAMRYGTVPIAHAVGGLADTVIDRGAGATGFTFAEPTVAALAGAVARAQQAFDTAAWQELVSNGMARDWSWAGPASAYMELYRELA